MTAIGELRALLEAAMKGPMTVSPGQNGVADCFDVLGPKRLPTSEPYEPATRWKVFAQCTLEPDAALIAALHNAAPDLLRIAEAVAGLKPSETGAPYDVHCRICNACSRFDVSDRPNFQTYDEEGARYARWFDMAESRALAAMEHADDCAWVLARSMVGE